MSTPVQVHGKTARASAAARKRRIGRAFHWSIRTVLLLVVLALVLATYLVACMPGRSYRGPLAALTTVEAALRDQLRADVVRLAMGIGPRCLSNAQALHAAAEFIEGELRAAGYVVERQPCTVEGISTCNLAAELPGTTRPGEILIVGAHYDTVSGCPGANDNASAVAALLALARQFAGRPGARTLRFLAFTNEEPPYFQTDAMGSLHYARRCRARGEHVIGMLALETMGYYADTPGSQQYPPPFNLLYPSRGDFIAFVGNLDSQRFLRKVIRSFRRQARFPSEGAAVPSLISEAGWSDHWSFWEMGYPALMVTDTALFRYPHYHTAEDTPDKLDFDRLARVVVGLERVIVELVGHDRSTVR